MTTLLRVLRGALAGLFYGFAFVCVLILVLPLVGVAPYPTIFVYAPAGALLALFVALASAPGGWPSGRDLVIALGSAALALALVIVTFEAQGFGTWG